MQGNMFRKPLVNKFKQFSQSSTSQDLENAGMHSLSKNEREQKTVLNLFDHRIFFTKDLVGQLFFQNANLGRKVSR